MGVTTRRPKCAGRPSEQASVKSPRDERTRLRRRLLLFGVLIVIPVASAQGQTQCAPAQWGCCAGVEAANLAASSGVVCGSEDSVPGQLNLAAGSCSEMGGTWSAGPCSQPLCGLPSGCCAFGPTFSFPCAVENVFGADASFLQSFSQTCQAAGGTFSSGRCCGGQPDGTPCDDGNGCTQTDTCQAGTCVGTNPAPDGTPCDDYNVCTQTDTCQAGICVGTNPVFDGTSCNDYNACTQTDTCQGGVCVGTNPTVCQPLDGCHVAGTCNPESGVCSNPNAPDGTPCSFGSGSACPATATCQSGVCGCVEGCPLPQWGCCVGADVTMNTSSGACGSEDSFVLGSTEGDPQSACIRLGGTWSDGLCPQPWCGPPSACCEFPLSSSPEPCVFETVFGASPSLLQTFNALCQGLGGTVSPGRCCGGEPDGTICGPGTACSAPDACLVEACVPAQCASATVAAGGTVATGTTTNANQPEQTSVMSPTAGTISITETAVVSNPPPLSFGFGGLGEEVTISAPQATAAAPLMVMFLIDASQIRGADPSTIQVFKDGVSIPACAGTPGVASPDPCVSARQLTGGGGVQLTVLTSSASIWTLAGPVTTTTTTTTTSTTTTTLFASACGSTPVSGCQPAATAKALLELKKGTTPATDKLLWQWVSSGTVSVSDFGTPIASTDYLLCLYDAAGKLLSAEALAGGTCGTKPCWKVSGRTGFSYTNKAATPDGLTKVLLKAGGAGKGKLQAKGGGTNLPLPTLPLTTPVRAQLRQSSSTCWEATYSTTSMNSPTEFKAKSE